MTIKDIREKTQLSQSEFAIKYGIPVRTLQQWEQNRSTPPEYVISMLNKEVERVDIDNNDYISQFRLMKTEMTLYGKALSNYNCSRILRNNMSGDKNQVNIIGFLLQQSVELMIKYLLEQNGVEYPKTNDIDKLVRLAKEKSVDLFLTEYVAEHTEMFSQWESKARYVLGYLIEVEKIDKAIQEIKKYLTIVSAEIGK